MTRHKNKMITHSPVCCLVWGLCLSWFSNHSLCVHIIDCMVYIHQPLFFSVLPIVIMWMLGFFSASSWSFCGSKAQLWALFIDKHPVGEQWRHLVWWLLTFNFIPPFKRYVVDSASSQPYKKHIKSTACGITTEQLAFQDTMFRFFFLLLLFYLPAR